MTVVFLCDYYHPFEIGGAERSAERLAIELGRRGVAVIVATPNFGAPPRERIEGVEVERLPFPQRLTPGELARRVWISNPAVQAWHAVRVAALVRRRRAAVVHVQNSPLVVAGWLAARAARARLIVTIRDLAYLEPADNARVAESFKHAADGWWAWLERRAKRAAAARADAIVFVSEALRSRYAGEQPRLAASARVVHNIAPAAAAAEAPRDPATILYVGKLSTGKGLHVLYDAIPLVARQVPDARFVLAGRPGAGFVEPPPEVRAHVTFAGRLTAKEVHDLLARSTVLVVPSIWPEPLSRVILEGMSAGVPVITTSAGGSTEAVEHGVSGWIVPPGDPGALAGAIGHVLADAVLARRLADGARAAYEQRFSAGAIVPQVLSMYEETLASA